ncbi:MAG: hypothetical protein AAF429_03195 [Pseudomonadota bacterium]
MENPQKRRKFLPTARLLASVIADENAVQAEDETLRLASNNGYAVPARANNASDLVDSVLVLSDGGDDSASGDEDENAFSDIGTDVGTVLTLSAANKVEEPVVTQANVREVASELVTAEINETAPELIQKLIEEIAPFRIANIFANYGKSHVEQVMNAYAPEVLDKMVSELATDKLDAVVAKSIDAQVENRIQELLPEGLEMRVAELVKEELEGAFGYVITRKIRNLIHAELKTALDT